MKKLWTEKGWENYLYWQEQNKKVLRKLNSIIKDIERSPYEGIGKPEPLKHSLSGWWSRHIDDDNRIVYRIKDGNLEISQCKGHYGDKR
jgi:toxin YoeB